MRRRTGIGRSGSARIAVGVLLLACTLGARLPAAVNWSLWQDEVGSERVIAAATPRGALSQVVRRESSPPAFYMTAWAANRAAVVLVPGSRHVRSLRVLSLLFSLGTTALTFVLACRLLPLWAAALAGLVVSLGSELVVHGSELRPYSLLAFVCVLFAFTIRRAVERPDRGRLAVLAVTVALGSLTHYFFLFTLAGGIVWLVASRVQRAVVGRTGAALALGLVPLVIWSPYFLRQYRNGNYQTVAHFTVARLTQFVSALLVPQPIVTDAGRIAQGAAFLLLVGSAVALVVWGRDDRLYGLLVLVPLVGLAVIGALGPRVFSSRNLIGIVPFAAISLAWVCASLPWRRVSWVAAVVVGALVLAGFAYGQASLGRTPYERIAREAAALGVGRGQPLVWFGPYRGTIPVDFYLASDFPPGRRPRLKRFSLSTQYRCEAFVVVARNAAGRRWLGQHRDEIVASVLVPSYGDVPQGRRAQADVIIARLRRSGDVLARAAAANALLFQRADARSTCTRSQPSRSMSAVARPRPG